MADDHYVRPTLESVEVRHHAGERKFNGLKEQMVCIYTYYVAQTTLWHRIQHYSSEYGKLLQLHRLNIATKTHFKKRVVIYASKHLIRQ